MSVDDPPVDEDAPVTSLSTLPSSYEDAEDDTPADFRFLTAGNLPKRGEKDFESHGTNAQTNVLEASRNAMHDALSYVRVHNTGKKGGSVRGWYFGDGVQGREEALVEDVRGRDLEGHIVMVEIARGPMFKAMGRAGKGVNSNSVWLLPEEALYLVERGDVDLYWPMKPRDVVAGRWQDGSESDDEKDIPLSLQAAWALLVGMRGEDEKIDLDCYTVYANLKRSGYAVLRAPDHDPALGATFCPENGKPFSIFFWLFGDYFKPSAASSPPNGPLIRPGLHRSYNTMYRPLAIIPRHRPVPHPQTRLTPKDPFKIMFFLYKTARIATFAKSNPGHPDFRIAIVPSHDPTSSAATSIPSLGDITSLLESTPFQPPGPNMKGDAKSYARIKHGYRNVILAVVDRGVTSFLRVSEAAFGEEAFVSRWDRQPGSGGRGGGGGKRGGFRGRGRGGSRGRGR